MRINRRGRAKIMSVIMMLLVLSGCSGNQLDHVPDELIGYWTTEAPGYATRYLKLEKHFILIGVNEDDMPNIQTVRTVDIKPGNGETTYIISSINSQGIQFLTLEFNPADGGVIQIRHKEGILWTRHRAPPDL